MNVASKTTVAPSREITITRIFDAPRELVWKAWTEPERFMQWWGPKGYTSPVCKIDLRVGGTYLACMRSPEGKTKFTLRHAGLPAGEMSDLTKAGGNESFDKLAESFAHT